MTARRYRVSHRTTYSYDEDVTDSLGIAYLVPRELPWQRIVSRELDITPVPVDQSDDLDFYGNTATYFQVTQPHRALDILATSEVEVGPQQHSDEALAMPWESARPAQRPDVADAWRAEDLALASALADQTPEAHAYAAQSLTPGRPVGEAVVEVMRRIHADFTYDKTATTVSTTVNDIFAQRAGVCQDFAHLTLACLRSHGLAVQYVSGYLATTPPPGKERIVGADATHAWAAVWIPGDGWLAIDPTNDQLVNDRYVTVAWGRDYSDVPPVKGVIFTEAKTSTLRVEVDVAPL
ncbi:transglutaminase family protein [Aeromicrobium wangtongii]|uniref:transglutaminase family protein n=1 Tax=Aeromicrobium wangtongii TaxID=2969247 RepID=UPI0020174BF3|nr:transglutaminase family protein [Aeromicrobium wangtongii]MCL3818843.1 transglutaminase family protein [Aeromicrobium wangtongii]